MNALREPTVFVIDDEGAIRTAIKNLLESVGLRVETFASAADFLKSEEHNRAPGCLVLDVRLRGRSGLDFQRDLLAANIEIPVIFVTGHGDVLMSVQAMKAGAVDFLTKPFRDQDLLDAVQRALARDATRRKREVELEEPRKRFATLTPREREVMTFVTEGLVNKQIAGQLGTSETTAKVHRGHVMKKMQARSLPDLVRIAQRLGIHSQTS
jgi:FixJ family two-component response regulator